MIDQVLFDWAPVVVALIGIAVVLDWQLTHAGAKASKLVRHVWQGEGSYEMNPTWEHEVDAGRRLSWRFVGVIAVLLAALLVGRYLPGLAELDPALFGFAIGAVTLIQAPIFMVHAANLQTFRALADPTAVSGRILFHRPFMYGQSGWHFGRYAVLWLILWVPSQQAFFLGGALGCLILARRMFGLADAASTLKGRPAAPPAAPAADAAPDSLAS
jgi:hypothetical protein